MTAPPATEAQVRARIIDLVKSHPEGRIFAVRAEPRWSGGAVFHVEGRPVRVVPCVSLLAARQALIDVGDGPGATVLLLDQSDRDLGDDLRARLARQRVFTLDAWETLRSLFHARDVDPRLADEPGIATALIEAVPSGGFPAARGGYLTADLAWGTLIERRLGLPPDPTLADLLTWTRDERAVRRWDGVDADLRAGLRRRFVERLGTAASTILDMLEAGRAPDALPLGLVLRALYSDAAEGQHERLVARGRLDALVPGGLPEAAAGAWADESERLVRDALGNGHVADARALVHRAERLLADLGAREQAYLSDLLELGFAQRLATLARAAERRAGGDDDAPLASALDAVERHALARLEPHRLQAARMAVRLARWLAGPGADEWQPASFAEAVRGHVRELSFVDWARRTLWPRDPSAEVDAAYRRLTALADARRGERDRRFAALYAGWMEAGSRDIDDVVPLEHVIGRVVAPLAAEHPVLMLVADGMSADVAHELVADLAQRGWTELVPEGADAPAAGVSVAPSVTEVCRATLLAGALDRGGAGHEGRRFAANADLVAASAPNSPPVLFHKADLRGEGAHNLSEDVATAAADARRRVVGAVVNAVDDLLTKGGELRPLWTPDAVPVLAALLEAAREAGRVVVLVSDHGHIIDRGTNYEEGVGGGERWRPASGRPPNDEHEVLVQGDRVLLGAPVPAGGHRIIAGATEWIRYSKARHDGYHGGATPRETVVPLRVLRPPFGELPAGWREIPTPIPAWWDDPPVAAPEQQAPAPRVAPRAVPAAGQQSLFETGVTPEPPHQQPGGGWIDLLLASDVYRDQSERLGGRARPDDDRVRSVLSALDGRGGTTTRTALAQAAGVPETRIDAVLRAMRRLLTVDGYAALTIADDGDTVSLNVPLLQQQFGI